MVSSADAYYAYDPTSAPISPQGGYFHYSIQLLSKLADQSCAELGTPDVQLPSDIFNCSVTHEPSWVSPRAPVYSNTPPRSDDLDHLSALGKYTVTVTFGYSSTLEHILSRTATAPRAHRSNEWVKPQLVLRMNHETNSFL